MGLSYGWSDTRLIFTDGDRTRIQQSTYLLNFTYATPKGAVYSVAVGPNMGGQMEGLRRSIGERWTIRPGVVWSLTFARRFLGTRPRQPFVLVVGTMSGSSTTTVRDSDGERAGFHAFDVKGDVSVGYTLGEAWSPYLALRAFGGPVFWRRDGEMVTGTDLYHVSVAAGFNLTLANRVSVFFDGAFVGLRSLSAGLSVRF